MALLTNLDHLKGDLNRLLIKILAVNDSSDKVDYYKEKLEIATKLEEIIKKHFETKAPDRMTAEQMADIAVNGWRPNKWNM